MGLWILVTDFFLLINGVWSVCVDESNYVDTDVNVTAHFSVKGQYPFVGFIAAQKENDFHIKMERYHNCAGTLLHRFWALTTARCVKENLEYEFVLGDSQLDSFVRRKYPIEKKYIHPRFGTYHWSSDFKQYNYALLRTKKNIHYDEYVKPVRLSLDNKWQIHDSKSRKALIYIGWGRNYHSAIKTQKQRWVAGVHIPFKRCKQLPRKQSVEILENDHICASSIGDDDLCPSDPGGPMIHIEDDKWTVVGVVSEVYCGYAGATVAAKIERAVPWIRKTLRDENATELFDDELYKNIPAGYHHLVMGPGEDNI